MLWFRKKTPPKPPCSMVVVAAGSSKRMGEDKLLLPLDGVPVIVHTLRALSAAPSVGEIVLVTREDLIVEMSRLCKEFCLDKVTKVVRGGETRVHSARLGTLEVDQSALVIGIHDGARPLVSEQVIEDAVAQALESGAACPAVPVKDTIRVAEKGVAVSTPERSTLFAVQTPQVFEASLIRAALQKAVDDGADLTDDCAAVERLGMRVALTQGDERNIKLTTPLNLAVAAALLEGSGVS